MKNLDNVSITAIGSNAERYVKDLMEKGYHWDPLDENIFFAFVLVDFSNHTSDKAIKDFLFLAKVFKGIHPVLIDVPLGKSILLLTKENFDSCLVIRQRNKESIVLQFFKLFFDGIVRHGKVNLDDEDFYEFLKGTNFLSIHTYPFRDMLNEVSDEVGLLDLSYQGGNSFYFQTICHGDIYLHQELGILQRFIENGNQKSELRWGFNYKSDERYLCIMGVTNRI
ncbi:MAG: hypothetical protein LKI18_00130 [Prevotella sp.]|jgi:hypothetical protein|nr:hypothetical protein [Prevotella sp.]